jgi:flagellar assembly protein FliH
MSSSPNVVADAFDFEQLAPAPRRERPVSAEEANSRAHSIIASAEAEAQRIYSEAQQQGYAEGYKAARAEAGAKMEPVIEAMAAAVEGLRELHVNSADAVERAAVVLAMEIAEKVVAGAIAVEPERVMDVVRGALRAIVERERLVIQVNPEDLTLVREGMDGLVGSLGGIEHVEVQEDRRVGRGGAIVRTTVGEIDAKVATKLDRAREAVEAQLR